jgi:hypothetical protein
MTIRYVVPLVAIAAIALAPQAHAYSDDEAEYLQALKAANISITANNAASIVDWGHRICNDLRSGVNPWAVARNTVIYGGASNLGVARLQVDDATVWLCPDEIARVANSGV